MVKSDVHMERVRTRLVDESSSIKKSEAAKKQRDLKKYGKQIQHEKLKQRLQDKKGMDERIKGIKRKRKDGAEVGDEDGGAFDIRVEDAIEGKNEARGGGRGPNGKSKVSRVFFNSRCDTKPDHQCCTVLRCPVTLEMPSSAWAVVVVDQNKTHGKAQTISTFPRARASPVLAELPSNGRVRVGGTRDETRFVFDPPFLCAVLVLV